MQHETRPWAPLTRVSPGRVARIRAGGHRAPSADGPARGNGHARAATAGAECEVCRTQARVLILEGYAEGQPVLRSLCCACAATAPARTSTAGERRRISLHMLAAVAGLVLCVVGLLGDFLVPSRSPGFGLHQQLGVGAGVFILVIGLLLRAEIVALAGGLLLVAAVCADWFGLTDGAGIGWKQQAMIAIGALGMLASWVAHRVAAARGARRTGAGRGPAASAATAMTGAAPAGAP